MLALRPYTPLRMVLTVCGHCFSDDPDREIEYEITTVISGESPTLAQAQRVCRWVAQVELPRIFGEG